MPSITIHLATANAYLKEHPEEDRMEFLNGAVFPDICGNYERIHHEPGHNGYNMAEYLPIKVGIKECAKEAELSSSFGRGVFFHLLTDYEFYSNFFQKYDMSGLDYDTFHDVIYRDYRFINDAIKEKYDIVFPENVKEFDISGNGTPEYLKMPTLVDFIERVAKVDLRAYLDDVIRQK